MKNKLFLSALAVPLLAIPSASGASVLFDFRSLNGAGVVDGNGTEPADTNFDTSGFGDTITLGATEDPSTTLVTTIIDVFAPEYIAGPAGGPAFVESGVILSSSMDSGSGVVTNITGQDALGINNLSINNNNFDLIGGGTESGDFNPGEGFIFSFDQDVIFTSIELESIVATDTFSVLIDNANVLTATGDDQFLDSLGGLDGLTIAAGSEITFLAGGDLATSSFRIETFEVDIVPEPSSSALIGLGGLMMLARRRR